MLHLNNGTRSLKLQLKHCLLSLLLISLPLQQACSSSSNIRRHEALVDQILKPRPGHEGKLTNQGNPKYHDLIEYDLSDKKFREAADAFKFVCKLGKKRYHICSDKPGLCRHDAMVEHYLDGVRDYGFLLNVKAKCFSLDKYGFSDQ